MKMGRCNNIRVLPTSGKLAVMLLIMGLFSCAPQGVRAAEALPAASEVIRRMIERSLAVAQAHGEIQYTYQKRSLLERLDADGHSLKTEEKIYQVTLIGGFPFKRLIKIQGRELTPEELRAEDTKDGKFRQKFVSADMNKPDVRKEVHIPTVVGHPFRFISDGHSNPKRTAVPIDIGQ